MKKVIVTGITGQDGSHMCDYLLKNTDFEIFGTVRRLSVKNHENIQHLEDEPRFNLVDMDLNDAHSIRDVVLEIQPDYFINFAAQSFVAGSWKYPIQTWDTDSNAVLHILESIRRFSPHCRFYNAGSSEEFGDVEYSPQDESHPLNPQSPYGAAKCAARHLVRVYRKSYSLHATQGWLFNHEGSRRGLDFVTRKISHGIASLKCAIESGKKLPTLKLGNLDAQRDWSDAEDFMEGVWLMLNLESPKNYVLGSGEMHTVREFIEGCLLIASIKYSISGEGQDEKFLLENGQVIVEVDPKFYRPAEVHELCGSPALAEKELGWVRKTDFFGLVKKMYMNDYNLLKSK
jgi:GDPmannose 4,6-dehydratase|tara:strand:+ start:2679 stop:3713 length:1035 start_codon:yes stop_codon:yes gene_type:complete